MRSAIQGGEFTHDGKFSHYWPWCGDAIGIGVEEYWQGILDQKCGINRITRFQDENVPITIAGEVKGFDPKNYMPGKLAKETGTFIQ